MSTDTPATESGSDQDGVSAFEAKFDQLWPDPPQQKAAAPAPAAEEVADELIDPDAPEVEKEEAEELEGDEPQTFKVKVDGKEIEVTADELTKGYSRQQDYTKKTMELAAERQQVQQVAEQAKAERAQYAAKLAEFTDALGEQLGNQPNWEELLENDPVEYLKQQHLYQARHAKYQEAQQARQQIEQQTQQQATLAEQQRQAHEREQLLANLPQWADDAKATKEKALIVKALGELGRTPEQLQKLDHIDVIIARKAVLYDQMVAKARDTTAKVEKLPPRMQKPGVSRPTDGRTVDMQALRKSGSTADAAALFEKMF